MDGAEQYVEILAQTGSENEADIKEEHLETNEDLDSSNTYSGVISGTDDDFHKLKNVVCKLEQISDRLTLAAIDDQYEHFGKYLATLLRGIPKKKFLSLKQKFVNDIIQAKMALDESTTSSLVTGNCTVTESVVDPIGVGNESSCLDNTCHCSTSKRLQSKGNASEQNVVPVSKTCTNSEPLKVLIIPPTPTITPPVFCPPILLAGDGNSTNNSSSNSLLARKRKRLMTSVPSKKLKKKPRCQPYINYIHHQDEQKTSDEPLPSQATEAVAHAHPLSVTEDHVEIEDENESENEVSSIDDSDADPLWSPGHINEPTNPGSVVSGYQVIAKHLANIYTHLQKVEENQDVMLQSKKIGNPDSSIIFEHNLQIPDVTIPCATNDDILKLEIWLSSSLENRNHMEAFLVRRGGKSVRSFIYRNLEKLFTNQLAKQCNWTGKYGKISIKKLDLTEILHYIDDACQSSSLAEQETVAERANKLLQLDNLSSSECKPQSPSTDMLGMTVEELDGMPKDKLLQLLESREETLEGTQESVAIVRKVLKIILGLDKPDEEASEDGNEDIMQLDSTEDLSQNVDEENISEENQEINTTVRKTLLGTDNPEEKVSADEDGDVGKLDSTKDNSQDDTEHSPQILASIVSERTGAQLIPVVINSLDSNKDNDENPDYEKKKKKNKRCDRRNFCIFCESTLSNLKRHLLRAHKKEEPVARYLTLLETCPEKSKKQRLEIIAEVRRKGNFIHNQSLLKDPVKRVTHADKLLPEKRPPLNAKKNPEDYVFCTFCYTLLSKKSFYKHVPSCKKKYSNAIRDECD